MKKRITALLLAATMAATFTACSTEEPEKPAATEEQTAKQPKKEEKKPVFDMKSTNTVGATKHIIVGSEKEPTGTYEIVCTSGHGALMVNGSDLHIFAKDDYLGKDQSGVQFVEKETIELNASDELTARNYNSSEFEIEFYLVESN